MATLAVLNSPELKAARAKSQVSEAQAFAAGLLADPQISGSIDSPTDRGQGYINAYGLGLSLDLQGLLTHAAKKGAAHKKLLIRNCLIGTHTSQGELG